MKHGGGGAKGSDWERQIASQLSVWWSDGARDDVFYRTGGSGGRATRRGRRGKSTANHCGDLHAADPSGAPLLKLCVLELKRGYNACTLHDLLDAPQKAKKQAWRAWIDQAKESQKHAGALGWMVLARRDKRRAVCVMDLATWSRLVDARASSVGIYPLLRLVIDAENYLTALPLEEFLARFTPEHIRRAAA